MVDIILPEPVQEVVNHKFNMSKKGLVPDDLEATRECAYPGNDIELDFEKLTHIFIVLEYVESDFKKLLSNPL